MQRLRRVLSRCAHLLLAGLLLIAATAGCPNSVGITCPPGQPACDVPDMSIPVDAAIAPDLLGCAAICTDGCCDDRGNCRKPSLSTCGKGASACMVCDTMTADQCHEGTCACGSDAPCALGTHCVGGHCVCDANSCPGCCDDAGHCWKHSADHCGMAGGACMPCDPNAADGCANGCTCGAGPACHEGQHCLQGQCVCDPFSCPGGCCDGGECKLLSLTSCGVAGALCIVCDVTLADHCEGHLGCTCGVLGVACVAGSMCVNGGCTAP
jgi:hypothetical protein